MPCRQKFFSEITISCKVKAISRTVERKGEDANPRKKLDEYVQLYIICISLVLCWDKKSKLESNGWMKVQKSSVKLKFKVASFHLAIWLLFFLWGGIKTWHLRGVVFWLVQRRKYKWVSGPSFLYFGTWCFMIRPFRLHRLG